MIEIKSMRGHVLYTSESAKDVRAAVVEAVRERANLIGANLSGADLSGANLSGAHLQGANLRGANAQDADLSGADLIGADLGDTDLSGANLIGADLGDTDFRGANLIGANLSGADLSGALFDGADGITFSAGPSGAGWMIPLDAIGRHDRDGEWRPTIGCWRDRTLDDLRDLIEDRAEWPEATGEERDRRRPYLRAVLALCEAHIAYQASEPTS